MDDNYEAFWAALGALTFVDMVRVAEVMRDAFVSSDDIDTENVQDLAFLLNTAREIAEYRSGDEEQAPHDPA